MPSMMAIVSKAVFEKDARGKGIGDTWATDRYISQHKALAALAGGDLYLVTVRPPDEALWLVAVLARPEFDDTQWRAKPNAQPIRDISALKTQFRFANGQGLPGKAGTLGMSLQTPRVLIEGDLALLAGVPMIEGDDDALVEVDAAEDDEGADDDVATKSPPKPSKSASSSKLPKPSKSASSSKPLNAVEEPGDAARGDKAIATALSMLRAGHTDTALECLLEAWADDSHPQLARLIDDLSQHARTPTPANIRGKTAAARAEWDVHAEGPSAADIPMLLESLTDASSGDAADRLLVVETWMPDPRIDAAFVSILVAVPYRATSTKPFWTKLFALLANARDPAQLVRLEAITFDGVAATMAAWLREKRDKLVVKLSPVLVEAPPRPDFDELARVIGGKQAEGAADRASVEDLFRAVYETPNDDGPRIVLADALIERNDPRGELITVQLQLQTSPDDRALRAREKELIDAHGKGWLGDLAPILMADVKFERGFLSECAVDNQHIDRVRKLVGNPVWSTVKSLKGSALIALDSVMRSLETMEFSHDNARNHECIPDAWRDLLVDTPRAIVDLTYAHIRSEHQWLDTAEGRRQVQISDHTEMDALCECVALPKLQRLGLRDNPILYIGRLAKAPVLERLEQLSFFYDRNNRFDAQRTSPLVDFKQLLGDARVPRLRFEIGSFHETILELERDGKVYTRAKMLLGPTMSSNWSHQLVDEAMRMLDVLVGVCELRVTTRRSTEKQQVARLRAAATQMNLDVCEVS